MPKAMERLFEEWKLDDASKQNECRLWSSTWLPWYGPDVTVRSDDYGHKYVYTPVLSLQQKEPKFDWFVRGYKKLLILAPCSHSASVWRKEGIDRTFLYHDIHPFNERINSLKRISEWKNREFNIKQVLNSILIIISDDCLRAHYHFYQLPLTNGVRLSFFFGMPTHLKDLWRLTE